MFKAFLMFDACYSASHVSFFFSPWVQSREAVAKQLYANPSSAPTSPATLTPGKALTASVAGGAAAQYGGGKVVYRTMNDGDFMLTNRQPTLHKPGMMGHRARIMRGEKNDGTSSSAFAV